MNAQKILVGNERLLMEALIVHVVTVHDSVGAHLINVYMLVFLIGDHFGIHALLSVLNYLLV